VIDVIVRRKVVVYNAVYDRKMMHRSDERHGILRFDWRGIASWYCAMEAHAEWYGDWNEYRGNFKWQKLVDATVQHGFEVMDAHQALADCHMTRLVVHSLLNL